MSEDKKKVAGKHWLWLGLAVTAAAAWVLVEVFADGRHVEAVLAFAAGLAIPGSPLGGIVRTGGAS